MSNYSLEFKKSALLTMGVELELQLVERRSGDLTRAASDLIALVTRKPFPGDIKPEITESMLEVSTDVHTAFSPLREQLLAMRDKLVAGADRLDIEVLGGGAHPFQRWYDRQIYDRPRFRHVAGLYGYLAKQFTVFGQHVHVGVTSGDDAVYLTHRLAPYIPHFIALSAASPFYQAVDTSFETSRLHAVSAFPLSGHMPPVDSWAAFNTFFDEMQGYGIVESMKDFYWDIRPKPEYGTIEVRIFDTPLTVELAAQLAAYVQTLAANLLRERRTQPVEPMYRVYGFNRFQACRFGFGATIVDPYTRAQKRLDEDILATLARLEPDADAMGTREALRSLARAATVSTNGSRWLRERFNETRSLNDMVRLQAELWAGKPS